MPWAPCVRTAAHRHLPAAAAARLPVRGRRGGRAVSGLARRLASASVAGAGGRARLTHGYDVVDHARVRRRAGRRGGAAARWRARRGSTVSAWWWTSCRTTWRCRPARTTAPCGRCCARARVAVRALVRHRLGGAGRPGAAAGARRPARRRSWTDLRGRRGRAALLRPRVPAARGHRRSCRCRELLDAQWYRLGWWRLARTELNYRRFFTISELIGVRVEDPEVFAATHAKILAAAAEGVVDGLRVDHPDGLADPDGYLRRLHEATRRPLDGGGEDPRRTASGCPPPGRSPAPPATTRCGTSTACSPTRRAPGNCSASTGGSRPRRRTGAATGTATVRRAAYKVVTHELAAEVDRLTRDGRPCASAPRTRRCATARPGRCARRCAELLVRLEVYRPYACARTPATRRHRGGRGRGPAGVRRTRGGAARWTWCGSWCSGGRGTGPSDVEFRARFAQTASALRAKSVEDTAFYRYVPLLSATEVGGDPGSPGGVPGASSTRTARACSATGRPPGRSLSTHDTKRSADVRAALAVLTECPQRWADVLAEVTRARRGPCPTRSWRGRPGRRRSGSGPAAAERRRERAAEARARGGPVHQLDGAGAGVRGGGGGVRGGGAVRGAGRAGGRASRRAGAAHPGERRWARRWCI